MWTGLESQISVGLLWTGHLLQRCSGARPLSAGSNFSEVQKALHALVGSRSGVWLGLELQINVRLLLFGHLLHGCGVTCPLAAGSDFSEVEGILEGLVANCFWDCGSDSLLAELSVYVISKKDFWQWQCGFQLYVTWFIPGKVLTRCGLWQPHRRFFPARCRTLALSCSNSETTPSFTCGRLYNSECDFQQNKQTNKNVNTINTEQRSDECDFRHKDEHNIQKYTRNK